MYARGSGYASSELNKESRNLVASQTRAWNTRTETQVRETGMKERRNLRECVASLVLTSNRINNILLLTRTYIGTFRNRVTESLVGGINQPHSNPIRLLFCSSIVSDPYTWSTFFFGLSLKFFEYI